ncbi:beta transducin, partial [Cladorrhinum sp. PSN332]
MRLINASTLQLEEFFNSNTPKYAILSHTWGNEEISLADARGILPQMSTPLALRNAGLEKIIKACAQALKDGLRYVWVDTCCIDKTSSAELSEAINSMFRWYEKSEVCYAYLADVPPQDNWDSKNPGHVFSSSRWFTRGWTLQELLAPSKVIFFASDWSSIATRGELSSSISSITGIDASFLLDSSQSGNGQAGGILPRLPSASMAERMSWAAKRETTRVEDVAYSLLGILGVNMPLIYGEGERAFIRLQEEVLRVSDDLTILAWGFEQFFPSSGLLAARPAEFEDCGDIIQMDLGAIHVPITLSGRQLSARLPLSEEKLEPYLVLPCRFKSDPFHMLAIPLARRDRDTFARASSRHRQGILVDHATWERWQTTSVKLMTYIRDDDRKKRIPDYSLCIRGLPDGFG